ncbi:tetratricopeptide repeat protein [Massilia sp. H-1]|nr:tetratricopeptide repeat protein [Massilia sp. H-1]
MPSRRRSNSIRAIWTRFSLLQYYLMAPGIVGGGTGKAETLTAQTAAMLPEAAKLMQAKMDLAADNLAKAEAGTLAVRAGSDEELTELQQGTLVSIAFKHLSQKRLAEAERIFNDTVKRFPDSDEATYGQARVFQEQGKHREALAILDPILLKDERAHVHYRVAKSLLAIGDKTAPRPNSKKRCHSRPICPSR